MATLSQLLRYGTNVQQFASVFCLNHEKAKISLFTTILMYEILSKYHIEKHRAHKYVANIDKIKILLNEFFTTK